MLLNKTSKLWFCVSAGMAVFSSIGMDALPYADGSPRHAKQDEAGSGEGYAVLEGKAFSYQTVDQLKTHCLKILGDFDKKIKEKEGVAADKRNPFSEIARQEANELKARKGSFLSTKVVLCLRCKGTGKVCSVCDGRGWIRCPKCKGSGKVPRRFWWGKKKCDGACGGVPNNKCPCLSCPGKGLEEPQVECSQCKSSGKGVGYVTTVGELLGVK